MSQPITNLSVGSFIKMTETVNEVSTVIPWMILAKGTDNPYGSDKVLALRKHCDSTGVMRTTNESAYPKPANYNDSVFDINAKKYDNYFNNDILSCIATSTVKCHDGSTGGNYTIDRKFFLLSYNEMGGNNSIDPSSNIPYFDTNTKRIASTSDVSSAVHYVTRMFFSNIAFQCGAINNSGALLIEAARNSSHLTRPACNILATTLVSDEPDDDGYYTLIPNPDDPYLYVRFHCSLGTVDNMPLKIRVDLTTEGNPEITSLQVCNNYGDASPTWETMTVGEKHTFTNTTKTADNWEIGVKVEARGENTIRVYEPFAIVQTEVEE